MLYKFKSKAAGDVIMTAPVGDRLMRIMGREPAAKGIFLAEQMPAAIVALQSAVAAEEAERESADAQADVEGVARAPADRILLRQRAWPLIEMMQRAGDAGQPIVWGV